MIARRARGKDGGKNLREHSESVPLVASEGLSAASQGHDPSPVLLHDILQHFRGVRRGVTVLVEGPPLGHGLPRLVVDFHLPPGDHRGGGVEEEGIGVSGHGAGYGVASQHGHPPEGGDHDRRAVREAEPYQPLVAGHLRVVPCDAVMIGIAGRDHCHAAFLRLFNGDLHCPVPDELPHPSVPVDHCGDRRFKDDLRFRLNVDESLFYPHVVADHALHSVAFYSVEVAQEQYVGDNPAFSFVEPEVLESINTKPVEGIVAPVLVTHYSEHSLTVY